MSARPRRGRTLRAGPATLPHGNPPHHDGSHEGLWLPSPVRGDRVLRGLGRPHRPHRPERRGQVDAALHPRGRDPAGRGHALRPEGIAHRVSLPDAGVSRGRDDPRVGARGRRGRSRRRGRLGSRVRGGRVHRAALARDGGPLGRDARRDALRRVEEARRARARAREEARSPAPRRAHEPPRRGRDPLARGAARPRAVRDAHGDARPGVPAARREPHPRARPAERERPPRRPRRLRDVPPGEGGAPRDRRAARAVAPEPAPARDGVAPPGREGALDEAAGAHPEGGRARDRGRAAVGAEPVAERPPRLSGRPGRTRSGSSRPRASARRTARTSSSRTSTSS